MKLLGGASWERSIEASVAKFGYMGAGGRVHYLEAKRRKGTGPFTDSKSLGEGTIKNTNANNIFDMEYAELPCDKAQLVLEMHLDFLDNWQELHSCTNHDVRPVLDEFSDVFVNRFGLAEFSRRYVENIINMRWTWRNYRACRIGREVHIAFNNKSYSFELGASGQYYSLEEIARNAKEKKQISEIITFVEQSLCGQTARPRMHVKGIFEFGGGREVYPSQLFPQNDDEKRKQLTTLPDSYGRDMVCFTREKLLNAIHTIDDWYCEDVDVEPVNVNPAGYDRGHSICCRSRNSKNDLHSIISIFEKHLESLKRVKEPTHEHMYLMAMILRGCLITDEKSKR